MLFKKMKTSFISSLTALISLFNVILMLLFVGMTFFMIKGNVDRNVQIVMNNSALTATRSYDTFLSNSSLTMKLFLSNPNVEKFFTETEDESVYKDASAEITQLIYDNTDFEDIWLVSSNGGCVNKYGKCMISETGLIDIPLRNERTVSVGSYYSDALGVIFYRPITIRTEQVGFIYAKMNQSNLGNYINASISGEGAYCMLLGNNSEVIYAPNGAHDILNGSDVSMSDVKTAQIGKLFSFNNGKTRHFYYNNRLASGWVLSMLYDGDVLNGDFNRSFTQQLIVLVCLFILELIATLNAIRHHAKDIPEITSSIQQISDGNYNFRINSRSETEIGQIARSVDELAQQLQDKNAVIDDYVNLDATTGLYNRYKMYEYLQDLADGIDEDRRQFALLFLDIDNFKWVTETLGHKQGDEFLRIFGQRVKNVAPKVFRFSGDEFVVISEFNEDYDSLHELIRNIKEQFIDPIEILNNKLYAHFSVGISIYPDDDTNLDMLLRDADIAMQRAKEKGKGHTEFFSAVFHQNVLNKSTIAQCLNDAVEKGELYLVFQPIISVANGDIHGFEALVRWESKELGYVSPADFVAIAEETGSIEKIGTWIFENGCRALKSMVPFNRDIVMSINVSAVQLRQPDFMNKVVRTLSIFDIEPKNLQIEITETSFVNIVDEDGNADKLTKLADMGIALALDDFGTGYSSFSYLKDMPIKTLKVDKSFVDEISNKSKDYKITNSIIEMVKSLGIKTVVEGVESIEQYKILSDFGCDYIQGFLMSKPLSERDALEFVIEYEDLHKPNERILTANSDRLARERERRNSK